MQIQLGQYNSAKQLLDELKISKLEQRAYLLYGCYAEYYDKTGDLIKAVASLEKSIKLVTNELEKTHLQKKKEEILTRMN